MFVLTAAARANTYTDPKLCARCHSEIYKKYQQSGMGRSFASPRPRSGFEDFRTNNRYYHAASDTWYEMTGRDGKYYQRRFQKDAAGAEQNVEVKSIDYILGSGNHARTYLHRTPQGTLSELPLAWYAEKGGYWAMSPGYDNPNHPGSRRAIGYDCMFCHNQYPKALPASERFGDPPIFPAELPEGIDCQRCHGPGDDHVKSSGDRTKILNPARLPNDRKMDVCLQCHLEPNSFRPALNFKRYERGWLSWSPAEPLSAFMAIFDTKEDNQGEDRHQIAGTAYEFQKSACFLKSKGALQCTTCHNPHEEQHAPKSTDRYNAVCGQCHTAHTTDTNCIGCHMPTRRTQDVVHVAMTDHRIRRQPLKGDLLADLAERTSAMPTGQPVISQTPVPALLRAVAQIRDNTNSEAGIPALEKLLAATPSPRPEPWYELAEAQRSAKKFPQALQSYRNALVRDPKYFSALLGLGSLLEQLGRHAEATPILQRATQAAPADARAWVLLGGAANLQKAAALDPDTPDAQNELGILAAQTGDMPSAEAAFREAIRIQPNNHAAHANLAKVLVGRQDATEAIAEFETAIRLAPADAVAHMDYGAMLNALRRFDQATTQLEAAEAADPDLAEVHELLGNLRERAGRLDDALAEYTAAVKLQPGLLRAQLDLGAVLFRKGEVAEAARHLKSPQPTRLFVPLRNNFFASFPVPR